MSGRGREWAPGAEELGRAEELEREERAAVEIALAEGREALAEAAVALAELGESVEALRALVGAAVEADAAAGRPAVPGAHLRAIRARRVRR